MKGLPTGRIDREALPRWARRFAPAFVSVSLESVDPRELAAAGIRLVLLDVDNTLVPWRSEEIPESTLRWIAEAKAAGLRLCILSNTRHPVRLERLARRLEVEALRGRFKPNPAMYQEALAKFEVEASEAVMIGDQVFTDVWGANRAGVQAILIRPMTGRDFLGTKLSRLGESLLRPVLCRGLETMESAAAKGLSAERFYSKGPLRHKVLRQFIKFAIVGGSSTVIDLGLHALLMFFIPVGDRSLGEVFGRWLQGTLPAIFGFAERPSDAAFPVFKVFSASVGILNSFYWNRLWTFRITGKQERLAQLRRFVVLSVMGSVFNTIIATGLNNVIPGHPKRSWAIASAIATVVVAFWNFTGQKYWAFRERPHPNDSEAH